MNLHRIRLRKPWRRQFVAGGVLWRRNFGRPTGLGPGNKVSVGVEGMASGGSVALNGRPLGRLPGPGAGQRYDVTGGLGDRNELEILLEQTALPEEASNAPSGEVFLEIYAD